MILENLVPLHRRLDVLQIISNSESSADPGDEKLISCQSEPISHQADEFVRLREELTIAQDDYISGIDNTVELERSWPLRMEKS